VATVFDEAYPLLRFATGDVGALAPAAPCACGRTAPKLAGILGRVGDAVKVKGMFVRGAQVEGVLRRFPEAGRFRATVTREDHVDHLAYQALQDAVKVRGAVTLVPAGELGEVPRRIDDRRSWT
jgi:phenylacetate-CoA ligase